MQNWDLGGIFRPGKAELIQGAMIRKDGQGLSCPITHFFFSLQAWFIFPLNQNLNVLISQNAMVICFLFISN